MTRDLTDSLATARRVADAVLYEGYVLFPYRGSAQKNRYRWQWGVAVPEAQVAAGSTEPSEVRCQCLLRTGASAQAEVIVRFLRVCRREVEEVRDDGYHPVEQLAVDGRLHVSWDEGEEREVATGALVIEELASAGGRTLAVSVPASSAVEALGAAGRVRRDAAAVDGVLDVGAQRLDAEVVRLSATVRNTTAWADPNAARDEVMRHSLVGVHLLLVASDAAFASVIDPPAWAARWSGSLENRHTHPVLVDEDGRDAVVLSAPIILPDYPELAPESTGDAFDATEIDELLTLSVQALTDDEKRQAQATDERAAQVIARADSLPPEVWERLHGAVRQFGAPPDAGSRPRSAAAGGSPAGDDDRQAAVDEELATFLGIDEAPVEQTMVAGRQVAVGDRVRLRPTRRADAQDLFAAGQVATVERIERDLEGGTYVGVTLVDDPGAELHAWSRRFLYFHPDEVEPIHGADGRSED